MISLDEDFKRTSELIPSFKERLTNPDFRFLLSRVLIEGDSVLDVGCYDGLFLKVLESSKKLKLTGIDLSELACASADENTGAKIVNSYKELTLKGYDTVISLQTLEHVDNPKKFVEDLIKYAKKRVIISTPIEDMIKDPMHKSMFSIYSIYNLIKEAAGHENFVVFNINKVDDKYAPNSFMIVIQIDGEDLGKRKKLPLDFEQDYINGLESIQSAKIKQGRG